MKIKKLSFMIIVIVIGMVLTAQLLSYVNFKYWGNKQIDILFENIVTDIHKNISGEIEIAENIAFNISVNETIQNNVFYSSKKELVRGVHNMREVIEMYTFNTKNIGYVGVASEGEIICYTLLNNILSEGSYSLTEKILAEGKMHKERPCIGHYRFKDKVYFTYISEIFPLDVSIPRKNDCYVLVLFEFDDLLFGDKKLIETEEIEVTLTDMENNVITSSNSNIEKGEGYSPQNNKKMVRKTVTLNEIPCKLSVSIPAYEILNVGQPSGILIVLIVILTLAIFVFLMLTLVRIIVKSILEIEEGAKIIGNGNYDYRIENKYKNEISNIAEAMNKTLDAIEESNKEKIIAQDRFYEAKLLQKQSEISQLQNQVSPHFLYNSMEYINNIAQKNNIQEIVAVSNIMAETFRYNTYGSKLTTVEEDIDYAFNYFNIINLRRTVPLSITYDVPEEILKLPVLKMTFQPILENVIKHAFKNNGSGKVQIGGYFEGDYAVIELKDNGCGISEEKYEKLVKQLSETQKVIAEESIGLLNVHKRLRIYFDDEKCGISVKSRIGEGTAIKITIKKN